MNYAGLTTMEGRTAGREPWIQGKREAESGVWAYDLGGLECRYGFIEARYCVNNQMGPEEGYVAVGTRNATEHARTGEALSFWSKHDGYLEQLTYETLPVILDTATEYSRMDMATYYPPGTKSPDYYPVHRMVMEYQTI